jgi:fructokinase
MPAQAHPAGSILIIGEALVDCFPDKQVMGGAPFNVARNLAAFGAAPKMVTRIGDDHHGAMLLLECQRFHLSQEGVQFDKKFPTGYVDVVMTGTHHEFLIANHVAWDAIDSALALEIAEHSCPRIVCFGTLAQRSLPSRSAIVDVLQCAKKINALRVLDLNLRKGASNAEIAAWSLRHADIAKVNDDELAQLMEWFVPEFGASSRNWESGALRDAIVILLKKFPLRYLVVTRGAQGYAAFDSHGEQIAEGISRLANMIDAVGAGDAFTSTLVLGEWLNWPLAQTLERAADFSAGVCTIRGAVAESLSFYDRWINDWQLKHPPSSLMA